MVEKTPPADMSALFDSNREPLAENKSGDETAFSDALCHQSREGMQSGVGQKGSDGGKLGRSLLDEGSRLVDVGMELLALGQMAQGMQLLRAGADRQRRATLLLSETREKGPSGQPGAPDGASQDASDTCAEAVERAKPLTDQDDRRPPSSHGDGELRHAFDDMLGEQAAMIEGKNVEKRPADALALVVPPGTRIHVFVNDNCAEVIVNAVDGAKYDFKTLGGTALDVPTGAEVDGEGQSVSLTFDFLRTAKS